MVNPFVIDYLMAGSRHLIFEKVPTKTPIFLYLPIDTTAILLQDPFPSHILSHSYKKCRRDHTLHIPAQLWPPSGLCPRYLVQYREAAPWGGRYLGR